MALLAVVVFATLAAPAATLQIRQEHDAQLSPNAEFPDKCSEGPVWLLVVDFHGVNYAHPEKQKFWKREKQIPMITEHAPVCVQAIRPKEVSGGNFWTARMTAVHDWLVEHPKVTHVVNTDLDIHVNPLTKEDLMARFESLTTPKAKVVVSMEQTCFDGDRCKPEHAQEHLNRMRDATGNNNINWFPNSQYMGERAAVISMLEDMLRLEPLNDQGAIHKASFEKPGNFAYDVEEKIFASMARANVQNSKASKLCNFGGSETALCDFAPDTNWGSCSTKLMANGVTEVTIHDEMLKRTVAPLSIHFNGQGKEVAKFADACAEALKDADV